MFWLEPGPLNQAERNVVYLCRPQVKYMKILAGQSLFLFSPTFSQLFETHSSWIDGLEQIKSTPSPNNHVYHLFVVPRMTKLCTSILEDMGVLGSIEIQDFMLGLIPIDKDVLSLEYEDVYKTIMLVSSQNERLYLPCISDQSEKLTKEGVSEWVQDNDIEPIYDMAKALMTLQRAFGTIPRLIGKGTSSRVRLSLFHSSSTRSVRWLFFLFPTAISRFDETPSSRTINSSLSLLFFYIFFIILESNTIQFDPPSEWDSRFNDSTRSSSRYDLCIMHSIDLSRIGGWNGRDQEL